MSLPYKYSSILVNEARRILNNEKDALERNYKAKTVLLTQKVSTLSNFERWRMPLVIAKIQHNKLLSLRDKKIFQTIQLNLQPDEDIFHIEFILQYNTPPPTNTTTTTTTNKHKQNEYEEPNSLKPIIPKLPLHILYTESNQTSESNSSRDRKIQEVARLLITQMTKIRKPKKSSFTLNHHRKRLVKSPHSVGRISPVSSCSLCTQSSTSTTAITTASIENSKHNCNRINQENNLNKYSKTTLVAPNTVTINLSTSVIAELEEKSESSTELKKSKKKRVNRMGIIGNFIQFCQYILSCSIIHNKKVLPES